MRKCVRAYVCVCVRVCVVVVNMAASEIRRVRIILAGVVRMIVFVRINDHY